MLSEQILSTLTFFDIQNIPLTLLELHKYLVVPMERLRTMLDLEHEIIRTDLQDAVVSLGAILEVLDTMVEAGLVYQAQGFYCLPGREAIIYNRLSNYTYGIQREKHINRFFGLVKHLPFIRAVAVGGSQTLGQQKPESDIDLFIITHPRYIWIARTFITTYFQLLGLRRHGTKIANRFCLNHYVAGPKPLVVYKNVYTAFEYSRLRPLMNAGLVAEFKQANSDWITTVFPHAYRMAASAACRAPSSVKRVAEKALSNRWGEWLEKELATTQLRRIHLEKYIVVEADELSFHPNSKQVQLLDAFLPNKSEVR